MSGTIHFHYDELNDIVIATPHWKITTEADVVAWFAQYERYMKRFPHKKDFVFVLDDFDVHPLIGAKWGSTAPRFINSSRVSTTVFTANET